MANIDDNIIHLLNDDIQKFSDFLAKNHAGLSRIDDIQLRGLKITIPELFAELLTSIGIHGGDKFIKVSSIDVRIDAIAEILNKENIKYDVQEDKIVVKYAGELTAGLVVVFDLQVVNNWVSCRSYLSQKHVKEGCEVDALKLLNEYNASTRHSKACMLEDRTITLLRNDNVSVIWDKENLREIILMDIIIMLDFYKVHQDALIKILSD